MFGEGNASATAAASGLTLRVRGGPRDGQVVKLSGAKCTIGSSPGCTLRLYGQDVRPVHCLVVRGKAQTVVRRWSADTLLNGEAFDDKQLVPGDRLRCGPVEFEVVTPSGEPCANRPAFGLPAAGGDLSGTHVLAHSPAITPPPIGTQVLPSLDGSMTVAIPQFRPLTAAAAADDGRATVAIPPVGKPVHEPSGKFDSQREADLARREAELAQSERKAAEAAEQCAAREQALLERETALARQEADLESREERLGLRELEFEQRVLNAGANAANANGWGGELAAIEEARRKLEDEREALAKAQREAAAQHAMHEAEHKRWQEDHRQWKAQRKAAEAQMEGLHAQVEHQLAEIMARRKNLDQDRDAWKTESETNRRQLEERAAEVARQAEEIERSRKEFEAQRQKAAKLLEETSRYEQLCAELTEARQMLATREQELAAAREELAQLVATAANRASEAHSAAETDYHGKLAQLEHQAEALLRIRTQLERERAEWDAQMQSVAASGTPARRASESGDAAPTRTRATDAPSNLSTWDLLKDRIDFTDDEPEDRATPRAAALHLPGARAEPIADEAESIERYMASLMERVGGRSGSTESGTVATEPVRETGPRLDSSQESVGRESAPATEAERPRPVVRKTQKTVTPEEVAAMRELANLNTRVAITRHGARRMVPNLLGKAAMSVVAWTLAVGMYVTSPSRAWLPLVGAGACALVGAMFVARTLTTAAQLFASRRAMPGDDTSVDGRAGTP